MFIKCLNRQPLLDALPACGSENCIVLLSDLMRNKELEEEQAHAFLTTIALIPHPSPQIIDSINVGTSAGHSWWPKSLIKATFCINSYNMSVRLISAEMSCRNTHIPRISYRPRGSAHPVSLLSALGLTGGPRGAVQGAAIWIIFGLSVVPKVTNLLQWTSSGTDLHTKAWGNPEGRLQRRKTHSGTYSRCSSCYVLTLNVVIWCQDHGYFETITWTMANMHRSCHPTAFLCTEISGKRRSVCSGLHSSAKPLHARPLDSAGAETCCHPRLQTFSLLSWCELILKTHAQVNSLPITEANFLYDVVTDSWRVEAEVKRWASV